MTQPAPNLITSSEAARILGVSQRTVVRWTDAGALTQRFRYPGPRGARLYDPDEVIALARKLANPAPVATLDLDLPEGIKAP